MPVLLYADDELEHRLMMKLVLRALNVTLIEADNGQEALEKIQEQRPDLILLNLFMPILDGFKVMAALKADPETRHIPIIVLSARPVGDNRHRALKAGASAFVAKPYDPFKLVQLVNKHLTGPIVPPTLESHTEAVTRCFQDLNSPKI